MTETQAALDLGGCRLVYPGNDWGGAPAVFGWRLSGPAPIDVTL